MKKEYYISILSGQQRGILASLILSFLTVFTYPYLAILNARNALYKYGIKKSVRLPANVISIGNITMGGTGKTPLVEFTARYLLNKGKSVAILSRGYGSKGTVPVNESISGEDGGSKNKVLVNDEYLVLRENLKEAPVFPGKDRVQNGKKAIRKHGVGFLILDDGFQHLRLKRDLDIVVIDALSPLAGNFLIPKGTLRGPLRDLSRAGLFVLSHCNLCDEHTLKSIYKTLHHINADVPVCETIHKPVHIESIKGNSFLEPGWLEGKRIFSLCAIGNPESFKSTLRESGADIIGFKFFRDHHSFTQGELNKVIADSKPLSVDAIVVTQKDSVKIRDKNINGANFLSLKIKMEITKGMEFYEKAVAKVLRTNQQRSNT